MVLSLAGEKDANAQARQFGDQGQLAITAENLFGFSTERTAVQGDNDSERAESNTQFGLFYRGVQHSPRAPWVGGHYFVIPNLSIGATLGFQTAGGSTTLKTSGTSTTTDDPSAFGFIFLPKVGYALMLNNMMGFWFRGGPGIVTSSSSGPDDNSPTNSSTFWLLSLDANFIVTPVQYIGFSAGPQFNMSVAGSYSSERMGTTVSQDASFRSFSIDAGLFGYFDL
ncbi:MAG: hypothetical protein ABW133_04990 [Polyangiaceae bacterium]